MSCLCTCLLELLKAELPIPFFVYSNICVLYIQILKYTASFCWLNLHNFGPKDAESCIKHTRASKNLWGTAKSIPSKLVCFLLAAIAIPNLSPFFTWHLAPLVLLWACQGSSDTYRALKKPERPSEALPHDTPKKDGENAWLWPQNNIYYNLSEWEREEKFPCGNEATEDPHLRLF